jgi:hypothetical protein
MQFGQEHWLKKFDAIWVKDGMPSFAMGASAKKEDNALCSISYST